MKKTLFAALAFAMLVGVAIMFPLTAAHAVECFAVETELRQYDPTKAYGGYILWDPTANPTSYSATPTHIAYLMDYEGYIVHKWENTSYTPRLLEDGTLWTQGQIMDWNGTVLWQLDPKTNMNPIRTDMMPHHDGYRIWNKKLKAYTYLMIYSRPVTNEEIWAGGGDPDVDYVAARRNGAIDGLMEVDKNYNLVWEWNVINHTCQNKNPAWPQYVTDTKLAPGKIDIHWMIDSQQLSGTAGIVRDWLHANSMDYNEDLDHIVINASNWSEFLVIDHGKTFVSSTGVAATDLPLNTAAAKSSAGDFIWRWGNPSSYNAGMAPQYRDEGQQQTFFTHNIQWISPYHWARPHLPTDKWPDPAAYYKFIPIGQVALPGAGNFLIYDNGSRRPLGTRSQIIEINPYLNSSGVNTGAYVPQETAGWATGARSRKSRQIVWTYASNTQHSFYSSHISGCQRLPNGNTSICAGNQGHMFEVTSAGDVVWEYLSPAQRDILFPIRTDKIGTSINVYRFYNYSADYPGLAGKDLTRIGTLTGRIPRLVGSN